MKDVVTNPFESDSRQVVAAAPSAVALAQREVAEVQSAMVIAKSYPRDQKAAMDKIITSCTRISLAQQAMYQYARGGTSISGPSIRLAEELARSWGNILAGVAELSRGDGMSECLAYAWDLESGYRDEKRFQVRHWRDTKQGGYALKDERDIYELTANNGSRRKRACILAVIPGDVVDAAVQQCEVTLTTTIEITPELIESLIEKFAAFNVTKAMLETRIQRRIESMTPALCLNLGKIYNSIKDGMSSPSDWFDTKMQPENGGTTLESITSNKSQHSEPEPEKKPEPEQEQPAEDQASEHVFVTSEVQALINVAKNTDQLNDAMDLIGSIQPADDRNPLRQSALKKYQELAG